MPSNVIGVSPQVRPAFEALLRATELADECSADRWQFATTIQEIENFGATLADVRWLMLRGFAEHAKEVTVPGAKRRDFLPLPLTAFPPDTCLVLTNHGAEAIRAALEELKSEIPPAAPPHAAGETTDAALIPRWNPELCELTYSGQLIKRYRVPAHNQKLVLDTFEELRWICCIDDPLPPEGDLDPKRRLADTIKSLNRGQFARLIKFYGNGEGQQVCWKALTNHAEPHASRRTINSMRRTIPRRYTRR